MNNLLFCLPLKNGALAQYKQFIKTTSETKSEEWKDLLARYDMSCVKIWHKELDGKDYVFVYHEIGPKASELLSNWTTSSHPFDLWFGGQLESMFDANAAEAPAESLFEIFV